MTYEEKGKKHVPTWCWNGKIAIWKVLFWSELPEPCQDKLQVPLEKLYQYENQPDMREKVREYIGELDKEIKRVESEIVNTDDKDYEARMMSRLNTLTEVRNDLQGRLDEDI